MNTSISSKRLLKVIGVPLAIALVLYLIWDGSKGFSTAGICVGVGLLLVAGAMLYIRQMELVSERNITKRIRAEYSSESQAEVFKVYEHLKVKELEGLFGKILDDAKGDVNAVGKFAGLAENVGWKAYLENKW